MRTTIDLFTIIDYILDFKIDAHPPKYRQEGSNSPEKNVSKTGTILSEDYAEIVDEEGDYSTPASECNFKKTSLSYYLPFTPKKILNFDC